MVKLIHAFVQTDTCFLNRLIHAIDTTGAHIDKKGYALLIKLIHAIDTIGANIWYKYW